MLPAIDHDVLWDAELSAAAAHVVASIMEWPNDPSVNSVHRTLMLIGRYYRLKNAERASESASQAIKKLEQEAERVLAGASLRTKAGKDLVGAHARGISFDGDAVRDWIKARRLLCDISTLREVFRDARLVRLFRARDELASTLSDAWLSTGSYSGAVDLVRRKLERQRLISMERDHEGIVLMNIHKSKGKEFDGVVLVEGGHTGQFLDVDREAHPYPKSRRLLRVGVTRARSLVTMVRPHGAHALVDSNDAE
jgi:DNA helicase-2/ATP-dependent DNA helicase PcrA